VRVRLHIERLAFQRIAVDHDRPIEGVRDRGFLVTAEISPPLDGEIPLAQEFDGFRVGDARKRLPHPFERGTIAFQHRELLAPFANRALHHELHKILRQIHVAGEVQERDFRLDHPELGQMPPGLGFLGTERRAEAVDLAERQRASLGVQLTALRQVGRLTEIVGGK